MIQIDMQMPDCCSACRFETDLGFCKAMPDDFCGYTKDYERPEWCPLKYVTTNNAEALSLVQKCLEDWPYAATRVFNIMTRLEKVKELLKEQGPIKPNINEYGALFCGSCGENVGYIPTSKSLHSVIMHYCPECGKAVKLVNGEKNAR